jgi:hypothetical protein
MNQLTLFGAEYSRDHQLWATQNLPAFSGTKRFIAASTRALHLPLGLINVVSISPQPILLRCINKGQSDVLRILFRRPTYRCTITLIYITSNRFRKISGKRLLVLWFYKGKAIPAAGSEDPYGLTPGRFLAFCSGTRLSRTQGHNSAGRMTSTEKFDDIIGNRSRGIYFITVLRFVAQIWNKFQIICLFLQYISVTVLLWQRHNVLLSCTSCIHGETPLQREDIDILKEQCHKYVRKYCCVLLNIVRMAGLISFVFGIRCFNKIYGTISLYISAKAVPPGIQWYPP